ncbi:MAG TPA: hypothetical protein VN838_15920, partial [Bradyrhizobium sp.]|nr:hypothetical protein [Bradyrhizobium sp.]
RSINRERQLRIEVDDAIDQEWWIPSRPLLTIDMRKAAGPVQTAPLTAPDQTLPFRRPRSDSGSRPAAFP